MKSNAQSSLCLPGETKRELWRAGVGGTWLKTEDPPQAGCIVAIESIALDSVPFWAVAPLDGKTDIAAVAALKWESLGLTEGGEGQASVHWNAGHFENRVLVGSAGLAPDVSCKEWLALMPPSFDFSPRLYPIPKDEAAVWRELGRYVAAFKRGQHLVHFCVLSARGLDAAAAHEINELVMALESQALLTKLAGVRVWTNASTGFTSALQEALATPVRLEPKPTPLLPADNCELFPPEIAQARRLREQSRHRARFIVAIAAVFILIFSVWASMMQWREHKLSAQMAEMLRRRPELDEVAKLQQRWQTLEPATNAESYPAELFQRIVSLLPNEGIRLKEFHIELDKLIVSGEASTVSHALKFKSDITGSEGLRQYAWNFPQPTILDDNRASFRAEGLLNQEGGTHEAK